MQRVKGHGNQGGARNGTENSKHENVNSWAHQGYNHANASMAAGTYPISNYYGASYHIPAYCISDGTTQWRNNEPITYVGNYSGPISPEAAAAAYNVGGIYNTASYNGPYNQSVDTNATSFNYYSGNPAEYPGWNDARASATSDYYSESVYNGVDPVKGVSHGLQSLDIGAGFNSKLSDPNFSYGARNDSTNSNEKKTTWASIAKQPAKPVPQASSSGSKKKGPGMPPPPMVPGRHNIDLNTWEPKNNNVVKTPVAQAPPPPPITSSLQAKPIWNGPVLCAENSNEASVHFESSKLMMPPPQPLLSSLHTNAKSTNSSTQSHKPSHSSRPTDVSPAASSSTSASTTPTNYQPPPASTRPAPVTESFSNSAITASVPPSTANSVSGSNFLSHSVVGKLKDRNNYNPSELELPPPGTRFFVIKSYSEDDVHRSIKYEIWCSTEHGNKRLDDAFVDQCASNGAVYLFFSVNGSGHFCGVARMMSSVDYDASSSVWAQDKWKGQFKVRWIYVKDVPNIQLKHIRLENNENKPVTNSRDAQEVPYDKGLSVLKIIHAFSHITSIFDDFTHYEKRQQEGDCNKRPPTSSHQGPPMHQSSNNYRNPFGGRSMQNKDRDGVCNNYSQINHNRRAGGGGGTRNGGSFTTHWNSNDLRS